MIKKKIIFDLDGTLAIINKRRLKAGALDGDKPDLTKINWDIFFDPDNVFNLDRPNEPVVKLAQMFFSNNYKIIIFSGRNDRCYDATKNWLKKYEVPYHLLVLRPDKFKNANYPIAKGNPATEKMRSMPDKILKKEMLDKFVDINDVFLVIEDRKMIVNMWRKLGLNTWQVAPGDF